MTTSHRPTWNPAIGGTHQGGVRIHAPSAQFSARDLPGHTKLKLRQPGQNTREEIKHRDLKEELEDREKNQTKGERTSEKRDRKQGSEILTLEDKDSVREREKSKEHRENHRDEKERKIENIDADDEEEEEEEEEEEDLGSDDSDSEADNEQAELLRELEKIKAERADEQAKKIQEEFKRAEREKDDVVLKGNPLLNQDCDFTLKRKWFDDSVFKNQARTQPIQKKRFINDTIRNDFHRRFLDKYIQ